MLYSPRIMDTQVDTWVGGAIRLRVDTRQNHSPENPGRFTSAGELNRLAGRSAAIVPRIATRPAPRPSRPVCGDSRP